MLNLDLLKKPQNRFQFRFSNFIFNDVHEGTRSNFGDSVEKLLR
jgi:hypothetical protein